VRFALHCLALAPILALGCGGDDVTPDASSDSSMTPDVDGGSSPPFIVEPPLPPEASASPVLTPCPEGWREVADPTGVTTCDPWPESGVADCAIHEAHFPGEPGCTTVGDACPAGDFAEGLPTDVPVIYVRPGEVGGDGSLATPYGTLTEAIAASPRPSVIALSKGTHVDTASIGPERTLIGACVEETILAPTTRGITAVIQFRGRVTLRNMRIGPASAWGVLAGPSDELVLDGVVIHQAAGVGLLVDTAPATIRNVVVRQTRPGFIFDGRGVQIMDRTTTEIDRAVIEENLGTGVVVFGPEDPTSVEITTLRMSRTVVRNTDFYPDGYFGLGVHVHAYSDVDIDDSVIEDNGAGGVMIRDGSTVRLSDVVVRGTGSRTVDGQSFGGVMGFDGGHIEMSRTTITSNDWGGVGVLGMGTSLVAQDVLIVDHRPEGADGDEGLGMLVDGGAVVTVARTTLARNRAHGIVVQRGSQFTAEGLRIEDTALREADDGAGRGLYLSASRAELDGVEVTGSHTVGVQVQGGELVSEDLTVVNTSSRRDGRYGRGLALLAGATATLRRSVITDNRELGISITGEGTTATIEDLVLEDTSPSEAGDFGYGVSLSSGAVATITRGRLATNHWSAAAVFGAGTELTVDHLSIVDTQSHPDTGVGGEGLTASEGGRIFGGSLLIDRSRSVAILATGAASEIVLDGLEVRETMARGCAETTCPDTPYGLGVGAFLGGRIELRHFLVDASSLCGVYLGEGGMMDLSDGTVSNNPIGACVIDMYDLERLSMNVDYVNNGTNLETPFLPTPDAMPTVDAEMGMDQMRSDPGADGSGF